MLLSALERGGDRRHRIDGEARRRHRAAAVRRFSDRLALVRARRRSPRAPGPPGRRAVARAGDLRSRFGRTLAQRNASFANQRGPRAAGSLPYLGRAPRRRGRAADRLQRRGGVESPGRALRRAGAPASASTAPRSPTARATRRPRGACGRARRAARSRPRPGIHVLRPQLDEEDSARRQGASPLRVAGPAAGGAPGAAVRRALLADRRRPQRPDHAA